MLKKLILSFFIILLNNNYSYSSELSDNLIDFTFFNKEINRSSIGIEVFDLNKNKRIYSYNSNSKFIPASNMKIITTLLALEYLGKDFQFETKLKSDSIKDNSLNNLYLEMSSDPLFTNKNLENFI